MNNVEEVIVGDVGEIGENTFADTKISKFTVGNIGTIGENAFANSKIDKMTIGNITGSIAENSFENSTITDIYVSHDEQESMREKLDTSLADKVKVAYFVSVLNAENATVTADRTIIPASKDGVKITVMLQPDNQSVLTNISCMDADGSVIELKEEENDKYSLFHCIGMSIVVLNIRKLMLSFGTVIKILPEWFRFEKLLLFSRH